MLIFAVEAYEASFTTEGSWFLRNVWLIPLLPAISFFLILGFGKKLPKGGAEIGIAAIGAAFVLAILANVAWIDHRDNFDGETQSALTGIVDTGEEVEENALSRPLDENALGVTLDVTDTAGSTETVDVELAAFVLSLIHI